MTYISIYREAISKLKFFKNRTENMFKLKIVNDFKNTSFTQNQSSSTLFSKSISQLSSKNLRKFLKFLGESKTDLIPELH